MKLFKFDRKNLESSDYIILGTLAVLLCIILGSMIYGTVTGVAGGNAGGGDGNAATEEEEKGTVDIVLTCAGDIMAHSPNIRSAYNSSTGVYDFSPNYQYVNGYIQEADLAMCNMETTFGGGTPTGYPMFNAPDQLAQDIKNVGFDVAFTSNNHMMDTGFNGMQRTIQVLRATGLYTEGSNYEGEANYQVADVNGVKVGLVGYTYETSGTAGTCTINGNGISSQAEALINSFNYHELDTTDYAKIQASIDGAREAGAQVVVGYFHWGEEYQQQPNSNQTAMAQKIADMGVDVIFASHPHVIQSIDVLSSADGRQVPVYYSLGNFISNQRTETLNNRYTEQGLLATVKITYDLDGEKIIAENVSALPVWVDKWGGSSNTSYAIVPLDGNMNTNAALSASGHLSRAQQALSDITNLIGQNYIDGIDLDMTGHGGSSAESERPAA